MSPLATVRVAAVVAVAKRARKPAVIVAIPRSDRVHAV
jgi:hypothetical protein